MLGEGENHLKMLIGSAWMTRAFQSLQAAPTDNLHQPFPTCRDTTGDPDGGASVGLVETFPRDAMQLKGRVT